MANPIFNMMNPNNNNNMISQFQQFMNQMQGQDPNAILNNLVSSGKLNQSQLDQVQARAKQMQGSFDGLRNMFGF